MNPLEPPGNPQRDFDTMDVGVRAEIDRSCREVVLFWYASSVFWLVLGSVLALIASIKLHTPWFLADAEWLTFGRIRPAHLNTMIYGWASMSGMGTLLWLMARLCKIPLPWRETMVLAGIYWNAMVAIGTFQILIGNGTSIEWIEFPWWISIPLGAVFLIVIALTIKMLRERREKHLYVSQWYLFGATIWFPFLYIGATVLIHSPAAVGVAKGTANWWFAHNVLGLWVTPLGIGIAYYLIPKILGRPIISYQLSLLGFWSLALFYSQVGIHHLVGGPIPTWLVTLSIVHSVMMSIPVITVAINHHGTMWGSFGRLKDSPTLRFVWIGALMYTVSSLQGSMEALRTVNVITHFTHYTIAHAHLGMYAFLSFILFGAVYFVMPRLMNWEWPWRRLISLHFWLVSVGILIYVVSLSIAGWKQGLELLTADTAFMDIVRMTLPYLQARTVGGTLMTLGHLVFAVHFFAMLRRKGRNSDQPALFRTTAVKGAST